MHHFDNIFNRVSPQNQTWQRQKSSSTRHPWRHRHVCIHLKLVLCYKFLLINSSTSSSKCIFASFFSNWLQFVELLILGSRFFMKCYMQQIYHTKSNWIDEGNLGREPDLFTGSICDSVDRRYKIRKGSKRYKFIMNGWNIKMNLLWHVMIMKCYFRHCIILLGGRI